VDWRNSPRRRKQNRVCDILKLSSSLPHTEISAVHPSVLSECAVPPFWAKICVFASFSSLFSPNPRKKREREKQKKKEEECCVSSGTVANTIQTLFFLTNLPTADQIGLHLPL